MTDVLVVRNSELSTWRQCRQKWWWAYVDRHRKAGPPTGALPFGSAIHLALEKFYIPGKKRGGHPVKLWAEAWKEMDLEDWEMIPETTTRPAIMASELGEIMMRGYWEQWGKDSNYEVLVPEQTFQLDVYDEHGNFLGVMVGTVDAVVRDLRTGRIGFLEHKTGKDLEPFGAPLIMDEQAGTYWTFGAMFLEHQGLIESANDLDFVLYNRLRKAIPDTRPKDEQGRALNRDGSVSKNQPVPLFKREYTWRDAHDRQAVYDRVAAQMHELQWAKDGDFFIYKSTDRHCGYCEFKDVCEVHETGGDWEQMFDSMYTTWNPYDAHELALEKK